jgi:triphosphatase
METELKLKLSAPELPRLLAHPLLMPTDDTQRLLNTYFDTSELALQQRRMAVRERLAGKQWLLTVKTAGQSQNGLSRRQE